MKDIKITAIIGITSLTGFALFLGHNGMILNVVIAAIAGIAGYEIGLKKKTG